MLKKNIAVIFEDSRYGGPHSQFLNLAQILKKKINFKVLISNIESSYFEKKIKKISLKYKKKKIFFLNKKIKNIINYLLKFLSDLYLIIKFVKTNESEYLYVPGGSTCIKSILAGLIMKKKILWHIHDVHSNIFIRLFYFFLSIFVWKIIFASKKSYEFYPNFLVKKKITILQSAVFKISAHKKIKKRRMKIGIVANFNPVKNIELFLRIVELFKKEKNFSFYLIGQVWESQINYYKKCKQLILKKKINNLKVSKELTKNFYKKIDILLCTSRSESSPLSIWEAVSAGVPIISTDIGDIADLSKKVKFAEIIKNSNETSFYKKIKKIYQRKNKYSKMSKNSYLAYQKFFNINFYGEEFVKLLRIS